MTLRVLDDLAASGRCKSFTIDPWATANQQTGTVNEYFPASASTNQISIAGFSFDAAGRMLNGTFAPVAAQHGFSWDPRGQMLTYRRRNAGGEVSIRCLRKAGAADSRQRRCFDVLPLRLGRRLASGRRIHHPNWQNDVLAGGSVIATVDASGNVTYLAADMLGTTRQTELNLTSASDATRFFPYGEEQNAVSAEYLWTGQMRDANGLDHFAMRTYAPALGRWLTPDPSGLAVVDPNNPQTWNRYAYTLNSPASLADSLGLVADPCSVVFIACLP